MLNLNINMNFSGTSTENEEVLASFNASYSGEKSVYISVSIMDKDVYAANKNKIDADLAHFTEQVMTTIADVEDGVDAK